MEVKIHKKTNSVRLTSKSGQEIVVFDVGSFRICGPDRGGVTCGINPNGSIQVYSHEMWDPLEFGSVIYLHRKIRGWTQKLVSTVVGCGINKLREIEYNEVDHVDKDVYKKLLELFELRPDDFVKYFEIK